MNSTGGVLSLRSSYQASRHTQDVVSQTQMELDFYSVCCNYRFRGLILEPVVRTWWFHCRGPGFNPWSGTTIPQAVWPQPKRGKMGQGGGGLWSSVTC